MNMNDIENLGIPSSGFEYQNLLENQDPLGEYLTTQQFLRQVFQTELLEKAPEIYNGECSLQFINYGDTELVYVLKSALKNYTVLVGQPAIDYGAVKREYENLKFLALNHPEIVLNPEYYFSNNHRELYMTPYLYQARCIASQEQGWGVYVPEPFYRFEKFSDEEQYYVNISIIANLIRLYDSKHNLGIASCKIGGGDFILEKEWSNGEKSIDNTLKHMKLIAARELITLPLENYIELLKKEFSKRTYYRNILQRDTTILVNHKSRIPMEQEEIEKGIQLGLKLREHV